MRGMAKYLMGILTMAFVAWLVFDVGADITGRGGGTQTVLARVNGKKIDAQAFYGAVRAAQEQQRRSQGSAPVTLEDQKALENAVLEEMVQQALLRDELRRRGITVTDEEIVAAARTAPPPEVQQIPEFQTDGKFDLDKYQRYLGANADPAFLQALEARYREEIPRLKLFEELASGVYVPSSKLWRMYRDQHDSATATVLVIQPETYVADSALELTDQELRAYYSTHREEFRNPATAFLSFVAVPRRPNAADTAAARVRADSVRRQVLLRGADFGEVAKRESADSGSAANGGDLGEVARGTMVPAFERAALALRSGQISEPVLTQFGYHIIKLESKSGNTYRARHILIPIELVGEHRDQVESRADSLDRLAAEQTDGTVLDSVARRLKIPVGTAAPLIEGNRLELGRYLIPDVGVWAFTARPSETSTVIEAEPGYYVFRLDSLHQAGIPPFDRVKDDVRRAAAKEEKWEIARARAKDMEAELKRGAKLRQIAERLRAPVKTLGPFTRMNPPIDLYGAFPVIGAAFGLGVGEVGGPYETNDGIFFVEPAFRRLADSTKFAAQLEQQRLQVIQAARQDRVRQVLTSLRASAKVDDNRKELEQAARDTTGLGLVR
ncbi:MAG: peptidyl-prolyl cis-trans isomerase [Gemmatimonadetes bacterium]|nr:peptidyl-prolyl cis-trans isomerase [Gemmatimonadota bacterium]